METSLLNTFADNYKVDGTAYRAMFRVNDKVNAELYPNIMARYEDLPISLKKKYDQEVNDIIEGTKSFDPGILFHELQSPLMREINESLIEIMDNERKLQRYLDMLILPFGKVAGLFRPDDEIDSLNQTLDKSNIPPQQEYCQREIENLNYRAKRMTELIASQSPLENLEHCAMAWFIFLKKYAESLAALLLTYDIDLIAEQAKRGIVLIGSISENMLFMQYGSYKQAQERYTAWKERNGAVADDVFNTELAQIYRDRAISKGYMERTSTGFKWLFTKRHGTNGIGCLGYFCEKVFCPSNKGTIPEDALCKLFGVSRLSKAITQLHDSSKRQPWQDKMDSDIFFDA